MYLGLAIDDQAPRQGCITCLVALVSAKMSSVCCDVQEHADDGETCSLGVLTSTCVIGCCKCLKTLHDPWTPPNLNNRPTGRMTQRIKGGAQVHA